MGKYLDNQYNRMMVNEEKGSHTSEICDGPTKESDLSDTNRSIHVVTTASLPWLTGTAVNPLLRALYFQRSRTGSATVTLVIPWVTKEEERREIYPNHTFSNGIDGRKQQEALVRKWAEEKAEMVEESKSLKIQYYPASYRKNLGSILPLVDICSIIRAETADFAILEEPEHLNWFAMPSYARGRVKPDEFLPTNDTGWGSKFKWVVGIIHTNYPAYARAGVIRGSRTLSSKTIHALSKLVCRSYCHKIIKLSKTLPEFAKYKECVSNVHGVRSDFINTRGLDCKKPSSEESSKEDTVEIYFIGKILWAKGFTSLLECQEKYHERFGKYFPIDVYGGGPDLEQVKRAFFGVRDKQGGMIKQNSRGELVTLDEGEDKKDKAQKTNESSYSQLSQMMLHCMPFLKDEIDEDEKKPIRIPSKGSLLEKLPRTKYEWRKKSIPAQFPGPKDHASFKHSAYKIFVNASITEVLCTTTAEALAMGKFVIIPKHPSNEFFYEFPNCLAYENVDEFVELLQFARNNDPTPLSQQTAYKFTWEAAMDRLVDAAGMSASEVTELEKSGRSQRDKRKAWIHKQSGGMLKGDLLKGIVGEITQEDLKLKDYEVDIDTSNDAEREDNGYLLNFENNSPRFLALLSFIIAVFSYFAQR